MIGYYWSVYKIFWSFYCMFCTLLCFNYLGMLLVSLTPNVQLAAIVASSSYTMLNLFAGFIVPKPVSLLIMFSYYTLLTFLGKRFCCKS